MTGPQAVDASPPEENSAGAARDSTAKEPSNADCNSAAAAGEAGPNKDSEASNTKAAEPGTEENANGAESSNIWPASDLPSEDNSTDREVGEVLNILDLPDETKKWLKKEYKTLKRFEEFIQMTSEKVKDMQQPTEKKARFKQDERETLILRRRWMEKNRNDGQEVEWEDYKCEELQYLCS